VVKVLVLVRESILVIEDEDEDEGDWARWDGVS